MSEKNDIYVIFEHTAGKSISEHGTEEPQTGHRNIFAYVVDADGIEDDEDDN